MGRKELSRNKMHISDAGSIVQVKDENRRNTDVFQGLRTKNWAIETSQNAQIISRQFLIYFPGLSLLSQAMNSSRGSLPSLHASRLARASTDQAVNSSRVISP